MTEDPASNDLTDFTDALKAIAEQAVYTRHKMEEFALHSPDTPSVLAQMKDEALYLMKTVTLFIDNLCSFIERCRGLALLAPPVSRETSASPVSRETVDPPTPEAASEPAEPAEPAVPFFALPAAEPDPDPAPNDPAADGVYYETESGSTHPAYGCIRYE